MDLPRNIVECKKKSQFFKLIYELTDVSVFVKNKRGHYKIAEQMISSQMNDHNDSILVLIDMDYSNDGNFESLEILTPYSQLTNDFMHMSKVFTMLQYDHLMTKKFKAANTYMTSPGTLKYTPQLHRPQLHRPGFPV